MKSSPEPAAGTAAVVVKSGPHRTQPYLPKWLKRPSEQQQMARARCLMILSVLSGQRSVAQASCEAKISRALYYQLESRALRGMLQALDPVPTLSPSEREELTRARGQMRALSAQVHELRQCKVSAERLLRLVLKTSQAPVNTARRGRPPKVLSMIRPSGADLP